MDISEISGCHLVSHELTAYLSIFNQFKLNELWSYHQKHVNQISLVLRIFKAFVRIFVDCKSSLESNSSDSGIFFVRGYLPLIRKDSGTHVHGLTVYVIEGLLFAWDLSLKNSADFYLCFRLALLHSLSYFFLYRSPSLSLCTAFDSISSNIGEILLIC